MTEDEIEEIFSDNGHEMAKQILDGELPLFETREVFDELKEKKALELLNSNGNVEV